MTPAQLRRRNAAIAAGVRRAWADPVKRERWTAAIRKYHDDPMYLAAARKNWANGGSYGSTKDIRLLPAAHV